MTNVNMSPEPTLHRLTQKLIHIYWSSCCPVTNEISLCVLCLVILATTVVIIEIWMCREFYFRIINKI